MEAPATSGEYVSSDFIDLRTDLSALSDESVNRTADLLAKLARRKATPQLPEIHRAAQVPAVAPATGDITLHEICTIDLTAAHAA